MDQLDRIEAMVAQLVSAPLPPIVKTPEAMRLLGVKSRTTFYALAREMNIHSIGCGKYRRVDITNALARRAHNLARNSQAAAASELKTESQRKLSRVNPDND